MSDPHHDLPANDRTAPSWLRCRYPRGQRLRTPAHQLLLLAIGVALILLAIDGAARAQAPTQSPTQTPGQGPAQPASGNEPPGDWQVTVGAGALYGPAYSGSDESEVQPLPFLDVTWRDRVFLNVRNGFGVFVLNEGGGPPGPGGQGGSPGGGALIEEYALGLSVRPSEGRNEDDDDHLAGMGDIDLSAEIGAFGSLELGPVELGAEIYRDVAGGHEGLHGSIGATLGASPYRRLRVEAGPFMKFGDGQYLESFYGVSAEQSARSGLAAYDAGSGIYAAGVEAMAHLAISDSWGLLAIAEYQRLVGDVADSPVVEEKGGVEVGAFLTYRF